MSEKVEKLKEEYLEECNDKLNKALAKRTLEFMKESITEHPEKDKLDKNELAKVLAKTSMDFVLESIIEHPEEEKLDRTELERLNKLREERITKIDVKHGEYKNEDLERINYDGIYFIAYSERGAMGEASYLNTIAKNGSKIELNATCFKDNVFDVRAFFENINGLEKILFCGNGNIKGIGDGWEYIYIGCGNNLLLRESVYKKFTEITKDYVAFNYYCYYENIAIELLNELK